MAFVGKKSTRRGGGSRRAESSWQPALRASAVVERKEAAKSEEQMKKLGLSDDLELPPGLYQEPHVTVVSPADGFDVPPGLCQFANTAFPYEAFESSCSTEASSTGACTPPRSSLSSVAALDVPPGLKPEYAPVPSGSAAAPLVPPGVFDHAAVPPSAAALAAAACRMPAAMCGQLDLQASSWASISHHQQSPAELSLLAQLSEQGPSGVGAPPGLEDVALRKVGKTSCHIAISGLPRKLLTEASVEVMLEQAALAAGFGASKMTGFTVQMGSCCVTSSTSPWNAGSDYRPEVVVGFTSLEAAELCCAHFHGMRWGTSVADCTVLPAEDMEEQSEGVPTDRVESPAGKMSKDAPMFVPSAWSHAHTVSKEASTDAGDSELSDDGTSEDLDLSPFGVGSSQAATVPMMVC